MPVRVGINGFGRIGRNVFRAAMARGDAHEIEWVAVNDLTDCETLAHLLKYDSILGPYPGEIVVGDERTILVDGRELRVLAEFQQHLERIMSDQLTACAASYPGGCCQRHHRLEPGHLAEPGRLGRVDIVAGPVHGRAPTRGP